MPARKIRMILLDIMATNVPEDGFVFISYNRDVKIYS